jgi:hypothetical protein
MRKNRGRKTVGHLKEPETAKDPKLKQTANQMFGTMPSQAKRREPPPAPETLATRDERSLDANLQFIVSPECCRRELVSG